MAKDDKEKDRKGSSKPQAEESAQTKAMKALPGSDLLTIHQMCAREAVSVVAKEKSLDDVVALITDAYKSETETVQALLEKAMEPLLAGEKAAAARKAADVAKRKAEDEERAAAVAEATAAGMVYVSVPHKFRLNLGDGKLHEIKPGTQTMLREMAEHAYSKANGVEILK